MILRITAIAALLLSPGVALAQNNPNQAYQRGQQQQQQQAPINPYAPGPGNKPPKVTGFEFKTRHLDKMPEFRSLPKYPGKPLRFMGGSEYAEPGFNKSCTFECGQPLAQVLPWYVDALKNQGWTCEVKDLKWSAHVIASLQNQPCSIDIQLLALKDSPYKTRVQLKETNYQGVQEAPQQPGTPIRPDQVKPLGEQIKVEQ